MKGMKLLVSLVAAVGLVVVCAGWDQVNTSVDGLNVKGGTLKIDGTAYTGTAAQLNSAVGGTWSGGSTLAITNTSNDGAAILRMTSDNNGDAGDTFGFSSLNGVFAIQSDISVKGTLATKASVGTDGVLNTLIGLDGIGAIDLDIGSADITDIALITDGTGTAEVVLPAGSIDGTEILDGTVLSADLGAITNLTLAGTITGANIGAAYTTNNIIVSVTTATTNVIVGAQSWVFQGPVLYSIGSTTYTTNGVQ